MTNQMFDEQELMLAIKLLKPNDELFEIRIIDDKWNVSGYFKSAEALISALKSVKFKKNSNFYFILNAIHEACYSRKQKDCFIEYVKPQTSDSDILFYEWLMIDIDPVRPTGCSASDDELEKAKKKANSVYAFLKQKGFNEPIIALSGNGVHLLYAIGLDNNRENITLVKNCLEAVSMIFSDSDNSIDKSTYNPARPCKIYGTMAQKGENTLNRPHRMSKIIKAPTEIKQNDKQLLQNLCDLLPKPEKSVYHNNFNDNKFDINDFINKHGIKVNKISKWNGGTKYVLEECVFNNAHTAPDSALIVLDNGALTYHCFHNSCADKTWKDVRLKFDPDAYDNNYEPNGYKHVTTQAVPNYRKREYKPYDFNEIVKNTPKVSGTDEAQPVFYTTEQIRAMPKKEKTFIKTGVDMLDNKIRGLEKGKITMLLGESGSGKSSLISQFNIESANQNFRTGYFSGELECQDVYEWLIFQAAGKQYIRPTQWENYFIPNSDSEMLISKWLNDKIFIYNNRYGNKFEFLKENLGKIVKEKKLDFVILDNLMSIDISDLAYEANAQQTEFVTQLKQFAAVNDVHILFVAHQKKIPVGILCGKYDNCGSSNLVNFVDNQFIIYRVNDNHIRLRIKENHAKIDDFNGVGNELRISKNRKGGLDVFIPLYFEKESKRLKNNPHENKNYRWKKPKMNFEESYNEFDLPPF